MAAAAGAVELPERCSESAPSPLLGGSGVSGVSEVTIFAGGDPTQRPGWGKDGKALHAREGGIRPERWCVTQHDLRQLRRDVMGEIAAGRILPSERDPFDSADDKIGPNMYTVVEQYVKPLTQEAGGMSWALLQHPEGIHCDVFVTHAWAEGVFEFIDKLLESWPRGKRAAWICVLANPQNLDISELISEPRSSPFALALDAASHVMVVPTQRASIYSRIWCVYEAYLGTKGTKVILTARPPVLGDIARSMLVVFGSFASTFLLRLVDVRILGVFLSYILSPSYILVFVAVAFNACVSRPSRIANIAGAVTLGIYFNVVSSLNPEPDLEWAFAFCLLLLFFAASEADRVLNIAAIHELELLLNSYSGVENAEASNEADRSHIFQDIGAELLAVEESVEVLQRTGMSTVALRKAHSKGLSIKGARNVKWAFVFLLMFWPVVVADMTYMAWLEPGSMSWPEGLARTITTVSCVSILLCVVRYAQVAEDERAFVASALTKGWVLTFLLTNPHLPLPLTWAITDDISGETGLLMMCLLSWLCLFGRARLMEVPCVGLTLVRILAPGGTICNSIVLVCIVGISFLPE